MRLALLVTSGVSLAAHVALAAALVLPSLWPKAFPPKPDPTLDPPPQNAGETFELPAPETADVPLANGSPSPEESAPSAPIEIPDAPAAPEPPRHGRTAPRASHEGRPSAGRAASSKAEASTGSSGPLALYGAVGDRSAADLSKAFTRDFPQAASGDPIWRSAALGDAGGATVILTLDDSGHIADVQITGSPTSPLAQGIRRTMTLIKGRSFVAKSKVTRLHVAATISADSVHDGLHGDVFAIGGSFADGEGSAFFALNIGRRVDLRVRGQ